MQKFSTDLTDTEWALVKPLVDSVEAPTGRPRKYSEREIVDAILCVQKRGCAWSALPKDYPPYKNVCRYFLAWKKEGAWKKVEDILRQARRPIKKKDVAFGGAVRRG